MIWATRLALLVAAAAAAYAGAGLVRTLRVPEQAAVLDEGGLRPSPDASSVASAEATGWRPIFGIPQAAAPPAAGPAAPAAPYTLKGLFATDDGRWAILSGPSWDGVVRVGDAVPSGERVAAIDATGVQLEAGGRQRRIAFDDSEAIEVSRTEVRVEGDATEPAEVRTQGMAPEDVREMLDRARQLRDRQRPATE